MIQPLCESMGPPHAISTSNECPCNRARLWPGGRLGSRCAASIVNDLRISICRLPNTENLVYLQTEPPARVLEAVARGQLGVLLDVGPVHRLHEEMGEVEPLKTLQHHSPLRIHHLQFVAAPLHERGARFGAHADPVE